MKEASYSFLQGFDNIAKENVTVDQENSTNQIAELSVSYSSWFETFIEVMSQQYSPQQEMFSTKIMMRGPN